MFSCYCLALELMRGKTIHDVVARVIGVTNMLEQAQVWQRQQQAKQAIPKYAEFLLEQIAERGEARSD